MKNEANYSPRTVEAAALLGGQIRVGRLERRWTIRELAERVGGSVVTLRKVALGERSVGLGVSFEPATWTGVPLFYGERSRRTTERGRAPDRLAVLPSRA